VFLATKYHFKYGVEEVGIMCFVILFESNEEFVDDSIHVSYDSIHVFKMNYGFT